jgi:predicted transposase/invertase (TIGR01784 family)
MAKQSQLWFGVMARMMKYIFTKDILPHFKEVILDLKNLEHQGDNDYTYRIISYLFEAGEMQNQDDFIETIKTGLTVKEEKLMTLAERYRSEGRAEMMTVAERYRSEGRVEGRIEGQAVGETAALRKLAIKMLDKGMNTNQLI